MELQAEGYARDDRPRGGTDPPRVAYVYATPPASPSGFACRSLKLAPPDRKANRPIEHLAGFQGILQTDGYEGYRTLARAGPAPIATEALARIAALYQIEVEICGRSPEERQAIRQARTRPLVMRCRPGCASASLLSARRARWPRRSANPLARWAGLGLFLNDGRVEIDSNIVERSMRLLALTRKNALFAGSDSGAEHWAVVASLVEACKLNEVEPLAYLTDVITKIVEGHPNRRLDERLPWAKFVGSLIDTPTCSQGASQH